MAKFLRPVPTFEQVVRQPVQLLDKPDRLIETPKPDPSIFDFHAGKMGEQQILVLAGVAQIHELMMRQAAQQNGADLGVMRGLQASAWPWSYSTRWAVSAAAWTACPVRRQPRRWSSASPLTTVKTLCARRRTAWRKSISRTATR